MGIVREKRAEKILEEIILDYAEEGFLPSSDQLSQDFDAQQKAHGDLTRSSLRSTALPGRWTQSSAANFNSILSASESDIDVSLRSLVAINELSMVLLSDWNSRSKALMARLDALRLRIESLLLLKSDTAGYLSFVDDGFLSLENVNSDTTASINTSIGEVTLNVDSRSGEGSESGTLVNLSSSQVTFGLIESGNTRFTGSAGGSSVSNIISPAWTRWGTEAHTKQPSRFRTATSTTQSKSASSTKPILGELKIDIGSSTEVTKISMVTSDANAGTNSVVASQYSLDGYTWENLPGPSPVKSGSGNFVWHFDKTEMRWVKFVISKASPDETFSSSTIYDFGIQEVQLFSEYFSISKTGNQIVSELLTPTLGGQDVSFGRASLEVCEEIPEETSLNYAIRAYDGSAYTSWIPVVPLHQEESAGAVVDFSAPVDLSSEDLTTIFDSSINTEALNILRVDGSGDFDYRFSGANDVAANFYINSNDDFLSDFVFLRNIGYSDGKYPTVSADLKVGDVECGWGLDGDSIYYCEFEVKNPLGLKIALGESQAVLDGRVVSGNVGIRVGWHSWRTDRANWGSLSSSLSEPTTETELKAIDPLYPYNHKYLIEGYTYPSAFSGNPIYIGADEHAQYKATRISRHDLLSRTFDPSVYATDVIDGPKTIFLMKFDSSRFNHNNERVRLFYTQRGSSYTSVQFKATLNSDNVERTPVLTYYRIRVK